MPEKKDEEASYNSGPHRRERAPWDEAHGALIIKHVASLGGTRASNLNRVSALVLQLDRLVTRAQYLIRSSDWHLSGWGPDTCLRKLSREPNETPVNVVLQTIWEAIF